MEASSSTDSTKHGNVKSNMFDQLGKGEKCLVTFVEPSHTFTARNNQFKQIESKLPRFSNQLTISTIFLKILANLIVRKSVFFVDIEVTEDLLCGLRMGEIHCAGVFSGNHR